MKKYKLLTLGIGSALLGSSSIAFVASCSSTSSDQNDAPNDAPINDNTAPIPLGPVHDVVPKIPLTPASEDVPKIPLNPSINTTPASEDVTSSFKSGIWTFHDDPSYQRRFFVWTDQYGNTGIPPVGDYMLHFQTVDESLNPLDFTFALHVDKDTGAISQSAKIPGKDGKTNLKINYAGVDKKYPLTSGQIYLDYFTPHSSEWWPYGKSIELISAKRVNYDSPNTKLVDKTDELIKAPEGQYSYSLADTATLKENTLYIAEIKIGLEGHIGKAPWLDITTLKMAFMMGAKDSNRIYSHVSSIQSTLGVNSVQFTPDGFQHKDRRIMTLSSTWENIFDYRIISLKEVNLS